MKKLAKGKRNQLILVVAATLLVLAAIFFMLIRSQYDKLAKIKEKRRGVDAELQQIKNLVTHADAVQAESTDVSNQLVNAEADVASGDLYIWTFETISRFKAPYPVDIPQINQPSTNDVDLLPQFPYKQLKVSLGGTAYYHDLGKFIADFENAFPHIRIVNLTLEPANADPGNPTEKLSFHMDIVALMKATP